MTDYCNIYIFKKSINDIAVSHYVKCKRSNSYTNSFVQTWIYLEIVLLNIFNKYQYIY